MGLTFWFGRVLHVFLPFPFPFPFPLFLSSWASISSSVFTLGGGAFGSLQLKNFYQKKTSLKELKIGEYKSEMNCQPACYICHNQRWSPQKKDKVILDPRPFPLLCLKKKQYKENQAIKKQGLLKIRLFNKERALEESKRGLIY